MTDKELREAADTARREYQRNYQREWRRKNPERARGEGADKPPTPARRKYGQYGWVKLTEDEYNRLLSDLGQAELDRCIQYIDESAQGNGNKNRWKDWNLVLRRCHREGWGGRPQQDDKNRLRTDADYSDGESFV